MVDIIELHIKYLASDKYIALPPAI